MKTVLLVLLTLAFSFSSCIQKGEASSKASDKDSSAHVVDVRTENTKIIGNAIDELHLSQPSVVINNTTYSYQEYCDGKDTIAALGLGKIVEMSTYSKHCEKEVKRLLNYTNDSKMLHVKISLENVKHTMPTDSSCGNTVEMPCPKMKAVIVE